MTNNVSGPLSIELPGNTGKVKTQTTQNKLVLTKVSVFSSLDEDKSKHVSGEEMKTKNNSLFTQYNLNTDAAKEKAYNLAGLQGSAIEIADGKVTEMKNFSTKLNNMLKKFKSSKLFTKLSPENDKTSVSGEQIKSTTGELDRQANTEFQNHAKNVQDKLSKAMAKALAEIANEAKIEGQKQDIANAAKSKDKTVTVPQDGAKQTPKTGTEQPKTVKLGDKDVNISEFTKTENNGQTIYSKDNKNYTLKDGVLTEIKGNENVEKAKENQEVKGKDSKGSNKPTFESLKAELGDAQKLPIAGSPKGYKAQAWNNMIKAHPELKGKEIQKMITEDNAKAALNRYLKAMET